jgi:hypothetical protein
LLDDVGAALKPKVKCVLQISHGAGIPDGGLFTPGQFQQGPDPLPGTLPSHSAIEAKPVSDDAFLIAETRACESAGCSIQSVLAAVEAS